MFECLLLLLLLTVCTSPLHGAASPTLTFENRDPITGRSVECDRCPPGTYLRARCSSTSKSVCSPCPAGSFTELWNHIGRCLRCGVCGRNQVVKTQCSAKTDCKCECKAGFYFKQMYEQCVRHSACPSGHGVLHKGTADGDTVCQICSNGTYSNSVSAVENCMDHKMCSAAGLQVVLRGAAWHDSVCADCRELKDGAEYLKEILPDFFVHHNMNIKRLRRAVHNLPSEDGKKQAGTSELGISELQARIDSWIASATAKQVRQLPGTLTKAGATSASERLQNKLRRIDASLKEQCNLGNEVEEVLKPTYVEVENTLS